MSEDQPKKRTGYGPMPYWPWQTGLMNAVKNHAAVHVFCCICAHGNGNTWHSYPSVDVLAHETGIDSRHVRRHLRLLEALGLIQARAYATGGRGKATVFVICDPPDKPNPGEDSPGNNSPPLSPESRGLKNTKGGQSARAKKSQRGAINDANPGEDSPPYRSTEIQQQQADETAGAQAPQNEEEDPFSPGSLAPGASRLPASRPIRSPAQAPPSKSKKGAKSAAFTPGPFATPEIPWAESAEGAEIASMLNGHWITGANGAEIAERLAKRGYGALELKKTLDQMKSQGSQPGSMVNYLTALPPKTTPKPPAAPKVAPAAPPPAESIPTAEELRTKLSLFGDGGEAVKAAALATFPPNSVAIGRPLPGFDPLLNQFFRAAVERELTRLQLEKK